MVCCQYNKNNWSRLFLGFNKNGKIHWTKRRNIFKVPMIRWMNTCTCNKMMHMSIDQLCLTLHELRTLMRHIVVCGLLSSTIFSSHYLINGTIFENVTEYKMCVWIFSTISSETFPILRRTERKKIKYVYWSSYNVPVILVRFWWNLNCLDIFLKNIQIPNFIKICPVGPTIFDTKRRMDRRTDRRMDKRKDTNYEPNSHFSQFCERA